MTYIGDVLDISELEREIAEGFINRKFHPEFPTLALIGYSEKTQFANHWTPTTRAARGIIYDTVTGEVVARPFQKFFNFGQETDVTYDLDAPILGAFDKVDGSLGIAYTRPDGLLQIATRGSFESDQAIHATSMLSSIDPALFVPGLTPLFEIVFPANRIVLDYGTRDELVFLGHVDIETGAYVPPAAQHSYASTLREVLSTPPRENAEGFVAWVDPWTAVKFKQDDYLALHRAIFSLSAKEVWRQLSAGTFEDFVCALPDEFHIWARDVASDLTRAFTEADSSARAALAGLNALGLETRKEQAQWVTTNVERALIGRVFSLLDGRDIAESIWRDLEPVGAGMQLEMV